MKCLLIGKGDKMPALRLRTWKSAKGEVYDAIRAAINISYRHFDCDHLYLNEAKIGETDKHKAIKKLSKLAQKAEEGFTPKDNLEAVVEKERRDSHKYGGRSLEGYAKPPQKTQLGLFDWG